MGEYSSADFEARMTGALQRLKRARAMQSELRGELRDALVLKKSDHPTQYRPQPHSNSHRSVASDVHERRVEESLVALRSQVELMAKQLVTVTEPQSNPLTAPDTEPQSNPLTAPDQVPQEHEGGDGNAELEGEGGDGNAELDEDGGEVDGEESGGVTGDGGNECERNDEVRPTEQLLDELKVEELLSDDWLKEEVPDGGDGSVSMDEQRREKRDDRVKQTVERLRQHRQGVRIPKWRHVAQGNNDPLDSEVLSLAGVFRASANVVIFVNRTQSAASQTRREDLEENRKTTESYLSVVLTQAYAWLQQQTKQVLHSVLTDESIRFNFVGVPISTARRRVLQLSVRLKAFVESINQPLPRAVSGAVASLICDGACFPPNYWLPHELDSLEFSELTTTMRVLSK